MFVVVAFANPAKHEHTDDDQTRRAAASTTGNSSNCDSIDEQQFCDNEASMHARGKLDVAAVVASFKRTPGHSIKHNVGAFVESKQPTTSALEHHLQSASIRHALHESSESHFFSPREARVDNATDDVEKLVVVDASTVAVSVSVALVISATGFVNKNTVDVCVSVDIANVVDD